MFNEVLYLALKPLLSDELSDNDIKNIADQITRSIEVNPREGSNVPFIRDSILQYLYDPKTLQYVESVRRNKLALAQNVNKISNAIEDLDKLSAHAFKIQSFSDITDTSIARQIFELNFGYEYTLGEIIYQTRFNQGGRRI